MIRLDLDSVGEENALTKCRSLLNSSGKILLLPTETVYGLICRWDDAAARERIFRLKQREEQKALQMLAANLAMVRQADAIITPAAEKLVKAFCPGPLTMIIPGSDQTVGFRIPAGPFILKLLEEYAQPLAATSANLSGRPPAVKFNDALQDLAGKPDLGIDAGAVGTQATASTVVDLTEEKFRILRAGPISENQINQILN